MAGGDCEWVMGRRGGKEKWTMVTSVGSRMWPSLISKAKDGGLDVIQTYVFWNLHEPQPGQYDFSGRRNIVRFIKEIQAQGLYASLRIGPYIESEWSYGGLPFWLHDVPGIVYRSDNEPFKVFKLRNEDSERDENLKDYMLHKGGQSYCHRARSTCTNIHSACMQIENEYQNVEQAFHERGPPYVRWAAEMAAVLQTGVPWTMCKQDDAPDPVVSALHHEQIDVNDTSQNIYQLYGENTRTRSPENIALPRCTIHCKEYHGGTNFGRSASAYVTRSCYDLAPLDEYGLIRQPKWGHLKELHAAIKLCSQTLLSGSLTTSSLGEHQEAFVFQGKSGECAAFLVNNDSRKDTAVTFQNLRYELPPQSISILSDCKNVAFNTAKASNKTVQLSS
ncbi:glycosyl hydrolase family 35 protein [Actinidia rufa]|uniref:beta-galactosidase n=1 Tax=Actinidia rufa TaxID=165716 RepID=A0A7J0GGA4_9ERIC|nr:glycosyl hydrolase family 35 protein [Actinidia rufa]